MINVQDLQINTPESHIVVPFYSQFADIQSLEWRKKGCGIASLAMVINYFNEDDVVVQKLLNQGINAGAFVPNAGWSHQGLINLAGKYGLEGYTTDLSSLDNKSALNKLEQTLKAGPVIASIHYKFEPTNPIPHLVVITAIEGDTVFYNDPAAKEGDQKISSSSFMKAWKKRMIVLREKSALAFN